MSDRLEPERHAPAHYRWQMVDQTSDPQWFIQFLDASRGPMLAAIQESPQQFYSYLDVQEGNHVLDVGAGTGDLTQPLARMVGPSGRVVGVDYSQTMVDEARRRAEQAGSPVEFYQGDIHHLEFRENTFDRVQVRAVFQHLPEPRRPLREIIRITKPGGKIAVIDPDWETLMINAENRSITRRIANLCCDSIPSGWVGRQLQGLFREAGLQDVTTTSSTIVLPPDYDMVYQLLGLGAILEQAQDQGLVTVEEAGAWQLDLQQRSKTGRFFVAFVVFTVTGRKA